jgi:cytosine/adenosine deaminase-related metal-dependent hydrolase
MDLIKVAINAGEVDDREKSYVPVLTNALQEYDYAYTIHLCDTYAIDFGKQARLVLIPVEAEEFQRGRYTSGLYFSRRADFVHYPKHTMTEELWRRIHESKKSQLVQKEVAAL